VSHADAHDELVAIAFEHCREMVYATARGITGDSLDAEDVAQAVFEILARRMPEIREPLGIPGFLKRCAIWTALDHVRRGRWREERLSQMSSSPLDVVDTEQAAWAVRCALERLPPDERTAALLRHVEQRTYGEIARVLGASRATARRRLATAEVKLREQLAA
jgi:RNA polymerase sigma factor (sigma-70 family)